MSMPRFAKVPLLKRFGALLLVAGLGVAQAQERPLLSPFVGLKPAAGAGKFRCQDVPDAYTDALEFDSKYAGSGKSRDIINPLALMKYKLATRDIEAFEKGLAESSDAHVAGRAGAAQCTLAWLQEWAQADAMLGPANGQGKAVRKWLLAAVAFNYLKVADAVAAETARRQRVHVWIGRLADAVVADYQADPVARMNNHHYWAAAAVGASGIILQRRDLTAWSQKIYRQAMANVDQDGVLPNEMARASRALFYHNYALMPLTMVAEMARVNGIDLYAENDCALCRLANRVLTGMADPVFFVQRTGVRQEIAELDGRGLAWLPAFHALCADDARLSELMVRYRPIASRRLGGNLSQVYDNITRENLRNEGNYACRHLWR